VQPEQNDAELGDVICTCGNEKEQKNAATELRKCSIHIFALSVSGKHVKGSLQKQEGHDVRQQKTEETEKGTELREAETRQSGKKSGTVCSIKTFGLIIGND